MPDSSPQVPPSRPRPSSPTHGVAPSDLFAHLQMIVALLLGILLFAVPLYLWRRPRAVQVAIRPDAGAPQVLADAAVAIPEALPVAPPPHVKVELPRVLECHDKGSKKTLPDQCDHVTAFEKAFGDAIVASQTCVPPDAGAGTIEYVADLSFGRRHNPIMLAVPKNGRSFQSSKIAKDCAAGVRAQLATLPVAPMTHDHARYKVAVVASYGAAAAPPPAMP